MKLTQILRSALLCSLLVAAMTGCSKDDSYNPEGGDKPAPAAFVDLGLSVLWAAHNVGADSPEASSDYFAWGETDPRSSYDEGGSLTCKKNGPWEMAWVEGRPVRDK